MLPASLPPPSRGAAPAGSVPSLGVYVHFPYCLTKCPYCDFLSVPTGGATIPHREYADAVLAELGRRSAALAGRTLHSVFFGGGTPSLWEPEELGRVLAAIRAAFAVSGDVEVTVECNPGSFDERIAEGLFAASVNRISLGVQGLNEQRLRFLGRHHSPQEGLAAIGVAQRAGFTNVSADLIFGVAGQTADDAADEARRVAATGVTHISAYALTIEPGTQFGELARRGRLPRAPEDGVADAFQAVRGALELAGYEHYEISNYARPGRRARHNLGYWRGEPYLGLGVGAWGTLDTVGHKLRYRNTPAIERYLLLRDDPSPVLDAPGTYIGVVEPITPEVDVQERLMLGLRLAEGVNLPTLALETGVEVLTPERQRALRKWRERGALRERDGTVELDRAHWLLADAIIREII